MTSSAKSSLKAARQEGAVVLCGTGDMMMTTIPHGLNGDGEYVLIDAQQTLDLVNESFCPYEQGITMDNLYIAY